MGGNLPACVCGRRAVRPESRDAGGCAIDPASTSGPRSAPCGRC